MPSITYGHYVAHARPGRFPLRDPRAALWLWTRLRAAFGDALAALLMPDHSHMIAPIFRGARRRLAAILGAFAKRFGHGELWLPVSEPEPLRSADKIARGVRYVLLNACRPWRGRKLASDPLEWPWSTHRDTVGAVADPWITADDLAPRMGFDVRADGVAIHRYVSSDPHVEVRGTPFPILRPPSSTPEGSLVDIARAAVVATRADEADLHRRGPTRRLFVALARRQGFDQATEIARRCGLHPTSVPRLAATCPPLELRAGSLCLGDDRLLGSVRDVPTRRAG